MERRRWQSLALSLTSSSYMPSRSSANAPPDASGERGSDNKRLTFRWRPSDQYPLAGSFADLGGGVSAGSGAAAVRTAFHSAARLCVSAATSSLDSLVTCSSVAVGHAPSAAPAALAEPGAGHSTAGARMLS